MQGNRTLCNLLLVSYTQCHYTQQIIQMLLVMFQYHTVILRIAVALIGLKMMN